MVAIVQIYIALRRDKDIQINMQQFENPLNIMSLHRAYSVASQWMQENKVQIQQIK